MELYSGIGGTNVRTQWGEYSGLFRTIKEEVIWINEFTSLEEAQEVIGQWIEEDYNQFYPHSKLGYKSPQEFEKQYYELQGGRALNLYTFGG